MDRTDPNRVAVPGTVLEAVLEVWGQARGQHLMPITGRSMLPLLREGDQVLVAHGPSHIRRGDLVVFWDNDRLVAHRVLHTLHGHAGPAFITKGDNAPYFDPALSANKVLGRVLTVKRGGRSMSLDTPAWRVLGWLIAVGTLGWAKSYGRSRSLKQRLFGAQPNRLTAFLRRGVLGLFSFGLKLAQAAVCRWTE
jgi:signal peptidase I